MHPKAILLAVATVLPICQASLLLDNRALASAESLLDKTHGANASYLETLSEKQRQVFDYVLEALDENFSPPFLVSNGSSSSSSCRFDVGGQFNSPRYSAWYAVGLLARNGKGDVDTASTMLRDV